jgi:hypothetical protein
MTTGIEDGIVIYLLNATEARRPVELGVGVGILLKPMGDVGLEARLVALGIERRAPALGRCEGDLGAGILEDIATLWAPPLVELEARRFLVPNS